MQQQQVVESGRRRRLGLCQGGIIPTSCTIIVPVIIAFITLHPAAIVSLHSAPPPSSPYILPPSSPYIPPPSSPYTPPPSSLYIPPPSSPYTPPLCHLTPRRPRFVHRLDHGVPRGGVGQPQRPRHQNSGLLRVCMGGEVGKEVWTTRTAASCGRQISNVYISQQLRSVLSSSRRRFEMHSS